VTLFSDVIRQPIWIDSLAHALCELAINHRDQCGLINLAGQLPLTRAEFAHKMLSYWGITLPSGTSEISAAALEGVPLDLRLKLNRANDLGFELPGVDDVLEQHRSSDRV